MWKILDQISLEVNMKEILNPIDSQESSLLIIIALGKEELLKIRFLH